MNRNEPTGTDGLEGIPGLGPARRASLAAAGITGAEQLRQATVDQLVGMTGMPRTLAQKTLDALQAAIPGDTLPVPAPVADEDSPGVSGDIPPVSESDPDALEPEPQSRTAFERHIASAQTALSDASRRLSPKPGRKLSRQMLRMASLLDRLPEREEALSTRRQDRVAAIVSMIIVRLEQAASRAENWSSKRSVRLAKRLAVLRGEIRGINGPLGKIRKKAARKKR